MFLAIPFDPLGRTKRGRDPGPGRPDESRRRGVAWGKGRSDLPVTPPPPAAGGSNGAGAMWVTDYWLLIIIDDKLI